MKKAFIFIANLIVLISFSGCYPINNDELKNISSLVYFIEDKKGTFSFEEVKSKKFIKNNKDIINFGVSNSVYWFKINLSEKLDGNDYLLEVTSPFLDKVNIYQKNNNGIIINQEIGNAFSFEQREIKANSLLFKLYQHKDNKNIYLRVYPGEFKYSYFTINFGNEKSFFSKSSKSSIANGIYFGFIFLISIYCLVFFITLKEKIFVFYALCSLCFAIVIGHLNGYTHEFVTSNNLWLNKHIDLFNYALSFFLTLFCMDFLQTKKRTPKLHYGLLLMIIYYFLFSAFNILGYMKLSRIGLEFAGLFGIYALTLSFITLSQGYKIARFYIIAQGSFFMFVNIFVMSTLSILPYNIITSNSLQIGSLIEIFFLSFAISEKILSYKKEKEEKDRELIIQANDFSRKIIKVQEDEKKRVAGELHDSLGQNIIVIKNKLLYLLKKDSNNFEEEIKNISKGLDKISDEVRNISYSLHPYHIKSLGITESLKDLIEEFSSSCEIEINLKIDNIDSIFSIEQEICIYRIVQECLSNCYKHANAQKMSIFITKNTSTITLEITDDGVGFKSNNIGNKNGFGLIGIKERVKILNGVFDIISNKNKTTISCSIKI